MVVPALCHQLPYFSSAMYYDYEALEMCVRNGMDVIGSCIIIMPNNMLDGNSI